jgi:hypothetical protein
MFSRSPKTFRQLFAFSTTLTLLLVMLPVYPLRTAHAFMPTNLAAIMPAGTFRSARSARAA